jgi:LysM repeat protein
VATTAGAHPSVGGRYLVRPGDTLSGIAAALGLDQDSLVAANGLHDPNRIIAGTRLDLPGSAGGSPAGVHVVRLGETLSEIAAAAGVSTSALARANGIDDANLVVVGRHLVVPARTSSGGASGSTSSAGLPARLVANPERLALMPTFDHWAATYNVPADLAKAVTWLESGWQNGTVSSAGAVGIGQLMPDTSDFMAVLIGEWLDPNDAGDNIRMSVRYLRWLLDRTGGNTNRALAGYYQGFASIEARGVYAETLVYVSGVQNLRSRFD